MSTKEGSAKRPSGSRAPVPVVGKTIREPAGEHHRDQALIYIVAATWTRDPAGPGSMTTESRHGLKYVQFAGAGMAIWADMEGEAEVRRCDADDLNAEALSNDAERESKHNCTRLEKSSDCAREGGHGRGKSSDCARD
jgi:hypothetical protein